MTKTDGPIHIGSLDDLKAKGRVLVTSGPVPIAVFYHEGNVRAVDNRCPHMGFPLHRGTIQDGLLTCHWHHARFDLASGCTFDLWADDVMTYPVKIQEGQIYLQTHGISRDPIAHGRRRLQEGMEQNIRLVIAKAVINLLSAGVNPDEIARIGGLYGVHHRRAGWHSGLTILTAMANVADHLQGEERVAPFYQGLVHVARDCTGQPPKFALQPLETREVSLSTLKGWFRNLVEVRDVNGAERCLLTAIQQGATDGELADILVSAATDHLYVDTGHVIDSINKAFELLDRIGWEQADEILSSLIRQLCTAQRGEEVNAWRHPVDLVPILHEAFAEMAAWLEAGKGKVWNRSPNLVDTLLGDDPHASVNALKDALEGGARPGHLAQALAYAAALRVARFHIQNEFADWIAVLHTFTYANALHQLLKRTESSELLRGVFHGAMRVYLDRFLNVPPARLPSENGKGTEEADTVLGAFLPLLDNQQQVDEAGRLVYRYLALGGDAGPLFRTLAEALLREDAEFHSFQVLEAAIRQHGELEGEEERRLVLVAAARYLAAHAPTQREMLQTLYIALRLHRGESVHEAEAETA